MMNRLLMALVLLAAGLAAPLKAEPADITAASRSVVRVVLAASNGDQVAFVGHGSGLAVAPDLIVTNAHVVEIARSEPSVVIGIVPSQGGQSYGGRVVGYLPQKDLALIRLEDGGRLPPMAIFQGRVADGADVVAIGYPGSVDRAQGLAFDDLIKPMTPVKTPGSVSIGRTTKQFETLLHTAPIASGNSGGPLVDPCGRVVGVNSFGSISEGSDAEFGFAVSARELVGFLREAGVKPRVTAAPCRSAAEIGAAEAARDAADRAELAEARERREASEARVAAKAREAATRAVTAEREDRMAIAALLLALSLAAMGGAAVFFARNQRPLGIGLAALAGALLIGAIAVFLSRPDFSEIDDRAAADARVSERTASTAAAGTADDGAFQCSINPDRSRVTVSDAPRLDLEWTSGGCINGRTQYGAEGRDWSRVFVPNEDQAVTISTFRPAAAEFVSERFLLDLYTMEKARAVRRRYGNRACSADPEQRRDVADMVATVRAEMNAEPNERLVYECVRQTGETP